MEREIKSCRLANKLYLHAIKQISFRPITLHTFKLLPAAFLLPFIDDYLC